MRNASPAVRVVHPWSPIVSLCVDAAPGVDPEAGLGEVAARLGELGVSALLVGGGPGIVTERDLVRALASGAGPEAPVAAHSTGHAIAVTGSTPIVEVAALMLNERLRHIVVRHEDGTGVVSLRDVAAVLLSSVDHRLWLASLRVSVQPATEIWLG